MSQHIELNTAYPVKVGWRYISVREICDDYLHLSLLGKAGESEATVLSVGETLTLDGVDYTLISVHHRVVDEEYPNHRPRHTAGILSLL